MDDRRRTLAAITVIVGFILIVAMIIGVLVTGKKVLSPVPEDPAIKIMFVTPTPIPVATATPSMSPTMTPKGTPAKKP